MSCQCKIDTKIDLTLIEPIFFEYEKKPGSLIPILQKTQEIYGYLPKQALKAISSRLKISDGDVFSVVTFYSQFHMTPRGKNVIRVCQGTACHVRGGKLILQKVEKELGIKAGHTTDDLRFTLETIACLGACGLSPVMKINDDTHGRLTEDDVPKILAQYK